MGQAAEGAVTIEALKKVFGVHCVYNLEIGGDHEEKYFTPSGRDASTYGRAAVANFGDAPCTIVKTKIPRNLFEAPRGSATVERGIRARVIPNEARLKLTPEVLNYSPVP